MKISKDRKGRKAGRNLQFVGPGNGRPGYYVTDITLGWRRVRRFAGYTKEEARDFLAKLRIEAKDGKLEELIKPKSAGDMFGAYGRTLLDSAEWKAKRSSSRNEISFKHLNRRFKDVRLADINAGLVRKYITERREEGVSPATTNRELSLLKSILYAAEFDGLIASNPIRGRRVKKLNEGEGREKVLLSMRIVDDYELQRRLVDCAAPHFKPILEIALVTGMRRGEIFKMKWKDADLHLGTIRVPAENAKTKRERLIPIDSNLVAALDSIERKGDYVFINSWTGDRRRDVDEAFRAACERTGIKSGRKEGLTFHDIRHLAAYRLVKVTDIVTAARILGHASIQMTMRYVHSTENDKRAAIEKAAEILFRPRQNPANAQNSTLLKEAEKQTQIN